VQCSAHVCQSCTGGFITVPVQPWVALLNRTPAALSHCGRTGNWHGAQVALDYPESLTKDLDGSSIYNRPGYSQVSCWWRDGVALPGRTQTQCTRQALCSRRADRVAMKWHEQIWRQCKQRAARRYSMQPHTAPMMLAGSAALSLCSGQLLAGGHACALRPSPCPPYSAHWGAVLCCCCCCTAGGYKHAQTCSDTHRPTELNPGRP
jgi:hypothetical protein